MPLLMPLFRHCATYANVWWVMLLQSDLTMQNNEYTITLKQLEDNLLARLSAAGGNFLGDTALVENLEHTKKTAAEIEEKVAEAKVTEVSQSVWSLIPQRSTSYISCQDLPKPCQDLPRSCQDFAKIFQNLAKILQVPGKSSKKSKILARYPS